MRKAIFLFLAILIFGCGHHEKATGGKKDVINPEIVSIFPDEFSDISNQNYWEITFSKPMDKNSIFTGINIYPPLIKKMYQWDKNTLRIQINEELKVNQNYYLSFSSLIRCERRNPLDKHYVFVYAAGSLNEASISGEVDYELIDDKGNDISLMIAAADSTFMFRQKASGGYYKIENLNYDVHIVTAFIDKNKNRRYDFGKEPYYRFATSGDKITVQPIQLAYADTTKPKIKKVEPVSSQKLIAFLSKDIASIADVQILSDSSYISILAKTIQKDKLYVATTHQDSAEYKLILKIVADFKNNISDSLQFTFQGNNRKSELPPKPVYLKPGNGESVFVDIPEVRIEFADLMPSEKVKAYLFANETQMIIDLILKSTDNKLFIFQPEKPLSNFTTYKLHIIAESWEGIKFDNEGEVNFIVIIR